MLFPIKFARSQPFFSGRPATQVRAIQSTPIRRKTLLKFRNGQQTDAEIPKVYSKADPATGQFRTLVQFVAPARDANKLMLKNGNDLWFYDPSSQASVRISPQHLLGQAANGDVVTISWATTTRRRSQARRTWRTASTRPGAVTGCT